MGDELHSGFAGPIHALTKLSLIYVLSEWCFEPAGVQPWRREDRLEPIRCKNISAAKYAIDCLVCRCERQGREVDSCRVPTPAEISPTRWDGEKRQTVAIIVIDEWKKKPAYKANIESCRNQLRQLGNHSLAVHFTLPFDSGCKGKKLL